MQRTSVVRAAVVVTAAGSAALGAYQMVIRPWHLRWGATDAEIARTLPGDDIVQDATHVGNRAVTIQAPPEDIWPWLVQIGKGRAGFYSYDWIENLMGLDIQSTDEIMLEFQQLHAGDEIPGFWPPAAVEPNRYLLFGGREEWGEVSWLLMLQPIDEKRTRLLSRSRYHLNWNVLMRALPPRLVPFYAFFEPGEFVMLRKMLLGIKERAEKLAREREAERMEEPVVLG
jgi:hypothetical protein